MKQKFFLFVFAILTAGMSGCSTASIDTLSPADITIAELEKRTNAAIDPEGRFAVCGSYIMRQEITEKNLLNDDDIKMVEVKFEKPDKIALITYEDNEPDSVFCTNGKQGWVASHRSRKIIQLDEKGLERMQMLTRLGQPGNSSYSAVFARVELNKCVNDDGEFYRVDCFNGSSEYPVSFYIDSKNYLTRMVKMKFTAPSGAVINYTNRILKYEMREGVQIPMSTVIDQDGTVQESKVIFYRLNPKFSADEFLPPVFKSVSRRPVIGGDI
ncbi:MAG: hypothetical protein E7057_09315 [Lentisphaerae bacterium]|nr:hypothetical protein [Lentisphaerota bacterium]